MELKMLKNEEKTMNFIMFLFLLVVPTVAFGFVFFFNGGSMKDSIALVMVASGILIRLFEKKLGKYAKYLYVLVLPVWGAVTIVIGNPGVYGAMLEAYFLVLFLTIPYYEILLVKVYAIVTVVVNVIAMILFPVAYYAMNTLTVWIFLWLVFLLAVLASVAIVMRARSLFLDVESKEQEIKSVLTSVQTLSENLFTAGNTLSQVSENESASAEELAATSEQLAESSNILSSRTDESMENLSELSEWEGVVADNVEKVETTSKELLDKSIENEKLLNNLHTINGQVSESMTATTDMAKKLSDAVQEIGATLNLINEISTSTNLLALNASIEAARAGEAGKGFAVVATEVGNLANNTQDTLQEVETVIERVQSNVKEITKQIEENSSKLTTQNEYFENVFQSMQGMTELLNISVDAINTMGEAHNKQSEVIKKTVSINQDIAQSIRNENAQFASINSMAENNANDTTQVATQASVINDMVDEMSKLLKRE